MSYVLASTLRMDCARAMNNSVVSYFFGWSDIEVAIG